MTMNRCTSVDTRLSK